MSKPIVSALFIASFVAAAAAQPPARASNASLVVRDVTLIDGTGAAPRPHASLVVRDGRLAAIVPAGEEPSADLVVDGRDRYAIPGLIDAHVHLAGGPWTSAADALRQTLAGGVTAVYDVAGDDRETGDLARAVLAGEIEGPSVYYAALMAGPPFFSDPRVLASSLGFEPGAAPWAQAITPGTDLVRAVAAARGTGATAIKLYAALDATLVRRIADEAHRQGLRLVAHATVFPAKPGDLVAAGVDMLAHAAYLVWEGSAPSADYTRRAFGDFAHVPADSPVIERLLESMRERGVALNPTLWIFAEGQKPDEATPLRTPWMNAVTKRASDLGVTIAAGTDDMFDRSRDRLPLLHRELETEVAGAGLTPMQALVSATRGAARAMGADAVRGTLEPGKVADLVLLDASPVDDIRNTRRIRLVVKDGRIVAGVRAPGRR